MADYPLPKFHFLVEWGGSKVGFTEVTGLDI
ncbi:phage tail protein, partial [Pontibacter qinzhouensis]